MMDHEKIYNWDKLQQQRMSKRPVRDVQGNDWAENMQPTTSSEILHSTDLTPSRIDQQQQLTVLNVVLISACTTIATLLLLAILGVF